MPTWNSAQYLKFAAERTRPSADLLGAIKCENPQRILDIGCGPANSAAQIKKAFPKAYIVGIDSSPDMILAAEKAMPNTDFICCDASTELEKTCGNFDIIFSNACLQWIPNHSDLLKYISKFLNKNGVLAVQIPIQQTQPVHKIIESAVSSEKWKNLIKTKRIFYNLTTSEYYNVLSENFAQINIWETTYCHILNSCEDIIEWYKGTGLRPYLQQLSEENQNIFLEEIRSQLLKAYPPQSDGKIIFPFPRLFFTAKK